MSPQEQEPERFDGELLSDAKRWLRSRLDAGARCPCCTQRAQTYRRPITSAMAVALIALYRAAGRTYGHLPTILQDKQAWVSDEAKLRYWGLIEELPEKREDGGRAGWWRLTQLGEDFVRARAAVPRHARIYDGRCLELVGKQTSIRDALGTKFNYDALMAGEL